MWQMTPIVIQMNPFLASGGSLCVRGFTPNREGFTLSTSKAKNNSTAERTNPAEVAALYCYPQFCPNFISFILDNETQAFLW